MAPDDEDLTWIPRAVRTKLDLARVRIHLADWQGLSLAERRALVGLPGESEADIAKFRAHVLGVFPDAKTMS